jgi:hypothetical protein
MFASPRLVGRLFGCLRDCYLANILPSTEWQDVGVLITHVYAWPFGLKISPCIVDVSDELSANNRYRPP